MASIAPPLSLFSGHFRRHRHWNPLLSFPSASRRCPGRRFGAQLAPICALNGEKEFETSSAASASTNSDVDRSFSGASSSNSYVGLFVRMLGLDNDPLDREQAIVTLWKYSEGGKQCIDSIMRFPGCINLVVSLLKSESSYACEAAAGLLHTVSIINLYMNDIANTGAIEEISSLLCQSGLAPEAKEQCLCTLWNLTSDEKLRLRMLKSLPLPVLVKFLDDDEIRIKEAAGGIVANLALSSSIHSMLVEAGLVSKLADCLKTDDEDCKVVRREAKAALLELAKDEYYRTLITGEGLVRVPIVGAAAYKALRPLTHSWPSLPDGTEIQRNSIPSRYGASELLLGLGIQEKNLNLDEAKVNAIVGRSQQQFLARIGAIEMDSGRKPIVEAAPNEYTLLPWIDGVARLVLLLGLEDSSAIMKSAYAIADAAINERLRVSFKEAGAVKHLVRLLHHDSEDIRQAVAHAFDKLSVSHVVRKTIEDDGAVGPLINLVKGKNTPKDLLVKAITVLSRILDPDNNSKSKLHISELEEVSSTSSSKDTGEFSKVPDLSSEMDTTTREVTTEPDFISQLLEILSTSTPDLQMKAATILEYILIHNHHIAMANGAGIELGLYSVFQKGTSEGLEGDISQRYELSAIQAEEIGLAVAAASRLLARLLDSAEFHRTIDANRFTLVLRNILKSNIPLHAKDWVAACLVKLESKVGSATEKYSIEMEVTLYETIPRLVEEMNLSFSLESREAAVVELNKIISKGDVEFTRAVAALGGIFPLVKLIEEARGNALEAGLAVLYNLSMDIENHTAIIAAGAVPILRRIVLSERPHWARALHILRILPV